MSKFSTELSKLHRTSYRDSIREKMDEESYKDFEGALLNPSISATAIVSALKAFGVEVSENTIRRWRKSQ